LVGRPTRPGPPRTNQRKDDKPVSRVAAPAKVNPQKGGTEKPRNRFKNTPRRGGKEEGTTSTGQENKEEKGEKKTHPLLGPLKVLNKPLENSSIVKDNRKTPQKKKGFSKGQTRRFQEE